MKLSLAAKVKKDNQQIKKFTDQLLQVARFELNEKQMNEANYSKMIDLITCINIRQEEITTELSSYINESRKRKLATYQTINVKI